MNYEYHEHISSKDYLYIMELKLLGGNKNG